MFPYQINIATFQRLNGYKPFLYNVTVDGCRFYKHQRSNPVFYYFFNFFKDYSNINHSCPYDVSLNNNKHYGGLLRTPFLLQHDIILDKVSISHANTQVTNVLPVPHGNYLYRADWYAYNIKRATVDVYAKIY